MILFVCEDIPEDANACDHFEGVHLWYEAIYTRGLICNSKMRENHLRNSDSFSKVKVQIPTTLLKISALHRCL